MKCERPKCRRRATGFAHLERGNLVVARCSLHFKNYEQFLRADKSVRIVEVTEEEALILKIHNS
jgi:hypothetical protein